MSEFPQYDEDGEETLSYDNIWRSIEPQEILGADCFIGDGVLTEEDNLVVLKLTALEFTEIFSALYVGAEFAYPSKFMQIIINFLKGLYCPPILEEQDCFEYPSYASFIQYSPINPYIEPDTIPDGYLAAPFIVNTEDGVPVPNYQEFDVLVPFDSLTLDVNWFEDIGGQLPQITVMVEGAGKVFVKMLNQVQGGLVVIELDNPPNILDIIGGIITGADNILDLNLDIVSLPPETAQEIIYEVDVVGTGLHTIYIVFLPILDDSLLPLRFGGGFRGVQLCDFVEQPEMGLTNIRFDGASCELQILVDGEWEQVSGWEDWLDCIPSSGGGGGGAMAMTPTTKNVTLGANDTTTSTTYATTLAGAISHVFTKSKALIQLVCTASNGGAASVFIKPNLNSGGNIPATNGTEGRTNGTTQREVVVADVFEDIPLGTALLSINWKVSGGTGTITANYDVEWTIIEYDEATDLFVEAVRINGEELQYLKGGIWITASDSLKTILDDMQADIVSAQASATNAQTVNTSQQTQINAAITVNNTQNTRLTALEAQNVTDDIRLDDLEFWQADAELSIAGLNASLITLQQDVSPLIAASPWWKEYDFTVSDFGWSGMPWVGGVGFGWQGLDSITKFIVIADSRIVAIRITVERVPAGAETLDCNLLHSGVQAITLSGSSNDEQFWIKVENTPNAPYVPQLILDGDGSSQKYLKKLEIFGNGQFNPFA